MRLIKARVQKYRSIRDTGPFEVEPDKTIIVGPNEAGKTALLRALQQLNPPADVPKFDALRDYPRSEYNDISTGQVKPADVTVVEGTFKLEPEDIAAIPSDYAKVTYTFGRKLDNTRWHRFDGGPPVPTVKEVRKDLHRLLAHVKKRAGEQPSDPIAKLEALIGTLKDDTALTEKTATDLRAHLEAVVAHVDEANSNEEARYDSLLEATKADDVRKAALATIEKRVPVFVLFNNYFRVRPLIHLQHLADRSENRLLDDEQYDYGNLCLLRLLGFTARQLSDLGKVAEPAADNPSALKSYRDQLDKRQYQLNAAQVRLTNEIRRVWQPNPDRGEADRVRLPVDGQYLKVVVEDDLGVEIELDQRSEGFQWLVSFFVVFFAEAADKHKNAILLLDEPGLSLHGLKQREFQTTISRLSEKNQTIYTTHSPFLVGASELDRVRVVEMVDRNQGTKVHSRIVANDPASLLPLQEGLGYDLAQSLFAHERNLVLEGLTDYWYVDATSQLLRSAGLADLNEKIALIPAGDAGKVVYFATILHANKLKVAALLDSDAAGDNAAKQDTLVHRLGNKNILRTKDACSGACTTPEVEDLLRETLVAVAKADLGWDVTAAAAAQAARPIVDIFTQQITGFSKYKLAKAYLRWTRANDANALQNAERTMWVDLIQRINKALK